MATKLVALQRVLKRVRDKLAQVLSMACRIIQSARSIPGSYLHLRIVEKCLEGDETLMHSAEKWMRCWTLKVS